MTSFPLLLAVLALVALADRATAQELMGDEYIAEKLKTPTGFCELWSETPSYHENYETWSRWRVANHGMPDSTGGYNITAMFLRAEWHKLDFKTTRYKPKTATDPPMTDIIFIAGCIFNAAEPDPGWSDKWKFNWLYLIIPDNASGLVRTIPGQAKWRIAAAECTRIVKRFSDLNISMLNSDEANRISKLSIYDKRVKEWGKKFDSDMKDSLNAMVRSALQSIPVDENGE